MAKEDFCFTYYDGDACRDMSHMNRLERGAYNDIVLQQRKFGRLTIDQIKKVLGRDFDECWQSINLVLVFDGDKYFIEWLETSILKMRKHSKKQSENVTKRYQNDTKDLPKENLVLPLEDENGNGDSGCLDLNEKESQEKITESIFADEQFVEKLRSAHRDKDLRQAFNECYIHHSNAPNPPQQLWQWRQKLNTWLTIKPGKQAKKATGTKKLTLKELDS